MFPRRCIGSPWRNIDVNSVTQWVCQSWGTREYVRMTLSLRSGMKQYHAKMIMFVAMISQLTHAVVRVLPISPTGIGIMLTVESDGIILRVWWWVPNET